MISTTFLRLRSVVSSIPAFLGALVPVFKSCPPCPVCMPKYAAILSLFGLELADYTHYLLPIMGISMIATVVFMYRQIYARHLSLRPLYLTVLSCGGLLITKYVLTFEIGVYFFMGSLLIAILWHQANIRKAQKEHACCEGHHH